MDEWNVRFPLLIIYQSAHSNMARHANHCHPVSDHVGNSGIFLPKIKKQGHLFGYYLGILFSQM